MNCSMLEDENYVNEIVLKIPVWIAEGEKDLTDNRSIWEWLKYNIRAHGIQYSIKKAQERNEKEESLQTNIPGLARSMKMIQMTLMQIV